MKKAHYTRHGGSSTPEYRVYHAMMDRCYRDTCKDFKDYGARGILVCDRWLDGFSNFISDMGRRPTPLHKIERINNGGHYEPGNCRWATHTEQTRNMRKNVFLTHNGTTKCVAEWAETLNVPADRLYKRIRREWTMERIFSFK